MIVLQCLTVWCFCQVFLSFLVLSGYITVVESGLYINCWVLIFFFLLRLRCNRSGPVWHWENCHLCHFHPPADWCGTERHPGSGPGSYQGAGSAGRVNLRYKQCEHLHWNCFQIFMVYRSFVSYNHEIDRVWIQNTFSLGYIGLSLLAVQVDFR